MDGPLPRVRRLAAKLAPRVPWRLWRRAVIARLALPRQPTPVPATRPVVFFAPEAGVTPHFAALCVVARTLQERGHAVLFTFCHELFSHCPVMDMRELGFAPSRAATREACLLCADSAYRMADEYGLPRVDLRAFATPELLQQVRELVAAAPADLREVRHAGHDFGKMSAMDVALVRKLFDFERVVGVDRTAWLAYLEGSILSYHLTGRLLDHVHARRVVCFNEYSLMLGARLAAEDRALPVTPITIAPHLDGDRRRFYFGTDLFTRIRHRLCADWPRWRELPLTRELVRDVTDDVIVRLRAGGTHTFSPAKTTGDGDLRARLGLGSARRLVVAYTSSLDEMMAARMTLEGLGRAPPPVEQLFADQVEWIRALMRLVEQRDDVQLAVRVHPREGGVKGVHGASQHLGLLRAAFERTPPWCRILWPDDPVSSYDLGEAASVAVVSWSTIGLELARLGVPTLTHTRGISPVPLDDFVESPPTREAYLDRLGAVIDRPPSLDALGRAYRWYQLAHLASTFDFRDVVPSADFAGLPPFRPPASAESVERVLVHGEDPVAINHARLSAASEGLAAEHAALRDQLARVAVFILTGEDPTDGPVALRGLGATAAPDGVVTWTQSGLQRSRYSPMVSRLICLCRG